MRRIFTVIWSSFFSLGIFAVDAQNFNISFVSQHEPANTSIAFGDVWAEGNIACLGIWTGYGTNYGVGIYDISNPATPILKSIYSSPISGHNQFELGAVRNKIGYFGSWSGGGVHIVSLTNLTSPTLLSQIGSSGGGHDQVHTVFLERNFLYEAAHVANVNTVKVIDVSNPFAPVFVRNIISTNAYKVHQITASQKGVNTILYTSDFGNGGSSPGETDIWDVSNVGTQPAIWLGRIISGGSSHSSWPTPDGNTLVVCRETIGGDVRLYDISNPASPTLQCAITPASMGLPAAIPHNPVVVSNLLFLSWYQNGIHIFDITDRTKPIHIGAYDTYPYNITNSFEGNWGVFPHLGLNKLLLSDIESGFYILDASAILTATNNYAPLILTQPISLTVTQGTTAIFSSTVTGSSLVYQWKFNGANIPGANSSVLSISNAQIADAGIYSLQVTNSTAAIIGSSASLSVTIPESAMQNVFNEDFDSTSSSNNWNIFDGSANGVSDYTVNWSFDYSTYFSAFNGMNIPPAPNSTNSTTRGVKLTVNNNDASGVTAGVSLYPKNKFFGGVYKLKFDMWINYPGSAGGSGSSGSTEHATFGINHSGTRVNWDGATSIPSDGTWFAVDGEGGDTVSSRDYRAYEGNSSTRSTLLSIAASGFSVSGAASANNTDPYFINIFPSPTCETPGSPGKHWVQVEISQDANNVLSWKMNGNLIAQRSNSSSFTNGNVMIGFMDLFNSIASPAADAFVLFDNVRVEIPVPATPPGISTQPQNTSVYPGQDAEFAVAATGSAPLLFQWRFNDVNIPGATNSSYTRFDVQPENVGNYSVLVANPAGSLVSSNAMLTLLDSPYIKSVLATPGSQSALISWNTTVPSDSQVQFNVAETVIQNPSSAAAASASFSSSSYIDRKISTNHTILLTGLAAGTRYSFQVISSTQTNSYLSGVYQFTTAGTIIMDNAEAIYTGSWTEGTISADKFGTNYQFSSTITGSATATATFQPNLSTSGKYDVYVWYPQGNNRATNVPYSISYDGGTITVPVNQLTGGGGWRLLASNLKFLRGATGFVRLSNLANGSVVIADAVKFTYAENQDFPTDQTIPAWWENFYFGGTIDPLADPDNDGYTTAQEYILGTSPVESNSNFQLDLQAAGNVANITFWPFIGNRSYQLLYCSNLVDSSWQILSPGSISTTPYGHGIFSLSTSNAASGFYRLLVNPTNNGDFSGAFIAAKKQSGFAEAACGVNRIYVK
jgi:hypothetical protein